MKRIYGYPSVAWAATNGRVSRGDHDMVQIIYTGDGYKLRYAVSGFLTDDDFIVFSTLCKIKSYRVINPPKYIEHALNINGVKSFFGQDINQEVAVYIEYISGDHARIDEEIMLLTLQTN